MEGRRGVSQSFTQVSKCVCVNGNVFERVSKLFIG